VPIYEYQCADCAEEFEKFVRYPETDIVLCPACGKGNIKQQISTFGFPIPGKLKPQYNGPRAEDFKPHDHDD
jgi:putative FmdB family regulatory protein